MPNYCENKATIYHSDKATLDKFIKAFKENKTFKVFIPEPNKEQLEAKNVLTWDELSWRVDNWGTKWDIGGKDVQKLLDTDNGVLIYFESAWSPPIEAYEKLVKNYGFSILAHYCERGMQFCGTWHNGEQENYEYDGNLLDSIPEHLQTIFEISSDFYEE